MKIAAISTATLILLASPALAAGNHSHSGGHGHKMMKVGMPGKAGHVSREVDVVMKETDDGEMIFEPAAINVAKGETIKFNLSNVGEIDHEFVLGDHHAIMEHKKEMEQASEMHGHDSPNAMRLAPGKHGHLTWSFVNDGTFEFACLIPGHYDAGMKGKLTVSAK